MEGSHLKLLLQLETFMLDSGPAYWQTSVLPVSMDCSSEEKIIKI